MANANRKTTRKQVKQMCAQFGQWGGEALNNVLGAEVVLESMRRHVGAFRQRVYSPLSTLQLFVQQVLDADGACQDAVARGLSERVSAGKQPCSLNTAAYCRGRGRLSLEWMVELGWQVGRRLEQALPAQWRWRGRPVKLLDGTTVRMPDTPENQAVYPQHGGQEPGLGFPLARLVGLISFCSGAVLGFALAAHKGKGTGEQSLFRKLAPGLEAGDLLLVDCYHCTFFTLALLQQQGVDIVTQQNACRVTDFRRGERLGVRDHVVYWRRPARPEWLDEHAYELMPQQLAVREVRVGGWVLVTTLLDAKAVSKEELGKLYHWRWDVELDLRSIKEVLGMGELRCKTPPMVHREISAYMLGYNLVRAVIAQAAGAAGLLPQQLSFKATVAVLHAFQEQLRHHVGNCGRALWAYALAAIASAKLVYRPNRVEPRAVKRRPKPYPRLMVPRAVARARLLDAYAPI